MTDIKSERERRLALWQMIAKEDLHNIKPQRLRELGIYGGAQGIWVDKTHTASLEPDGVTVGILHTGHHYPDDLSDDGVIYHYPSTSRPPSRDATEIQATKNAMMHQLPIFVVLPGKKSSLQRSLKFGWVCDFDDQTHEFLILFNEKAAPEYKSAEQANEPFMLINETPKKIGKVKVRPGQQRFRFNVMSKYGYKCAVCNILYPELLIAGHICDVAKKGSDDWRNGIPLCASHHNAFDSLLFCFVPKSGDIKCKQGVTAGEIGIHETRLQTLNKIFPHQQALQWRWEFTQHSWKTK
jgi:putative restriction endonuclease